jgi:hypothetical protein
MIQEADAGFLFRAPQKIAEEYKNIPCFSEYNDLLEAIKKEISAP